ncbi:MAG: hypothetical protein MJ200_01145 [Mycoplasmoidaceae bacterium]|nr:hypothetical protein [Mycoplasmoidaceae bacterium]
MSNKTPCPAQSVNSVSSLDIPKSSFSSLKILTNDLGITTPWLTAKAKPLAKPGV